MKPRHPKLTRSGKNPRRVETFYVDLDMCGGELFLEDFDLAEFCQVLQRLVPRLRIVPVTEPGGHAQNRRPPLVDQATFEKAITQYCTGCQITGCCIN